MALNNMGLGFVFTARNLASGTIGRLRGQLGGLSTQSRLTGIAMRTGFTVAAAGIVPLVAGLGTLAGAMSLANAAGEFQQGLAGVGAVTRATTEEMELLRQAAIRAGVDTQFSPTQAVEGLTSLATAGQTARQATESLIPVLQLAAGSNGQLGVADASEAVVGTLNAYSLAATEAGDVTDRLVRITQLTNFQARDFSAGLAKAAASGAVFGQEMNDTLITMGLLRNRNIDASSSATAFREATRRLGSDQRAQQAVQAAGVQVFDEATGAMRQLPDILLDMAEKTKDMTDQERNRTVAQALGARGLLAFNAIAEAQTTVVRDGREVILRGAEAIAHLRNEMSNATGVAEEFQDQLLNTFEGQKTLLEGTLQTFAIVLGEPFARVFKPMVATLVQTLNFFLEAFNALPDGMKNTIAAFIVAASIFSTVTGLVAILTGLFIVLLPFLKLIAIAFGTALLALLPIVAAIGLGVAAFRGFRAAFERDIGGIATFFARTFGRLKLGFDAIVQLFTDGGFSGAVREEMNRSENKGIRQFAINVFRIGSRIMEVFSGISTGFQAGLTRLGPTFERFVEAVRELGAAFGFVDDSARDLAGVPMDDFAATGVRIGEVFADALGTVVTWITRAVKFWTGFTNNFSKGMDVFGPVLTELGAAFEALGTSIGTFFRTFDQDAAGGENSAMSFGEAVGATFGFLAGLMLSSLRIVVNIATAIVDAFNWLKSTARSLGFSYAQLAIRVSTIFQNIVDSIRNAVDAVIAFVGGVVSRVPAAVRPAFANDLVQAGAEAESRIRVRTTAGARRQVIAAGNLGAIDRLQAAETEASNRTSVQRDTEVDKLARLMAQDRTRDRQAIQLQVKLDGERIATATAEANRREGARGFVPGVPSET